MSELDVEPGLLVWRKSSFSGTNGCVEVAPLGNGLVGLRDSKDPDGGYFAYSSHEWRSFLLGVRAGEFDDLSAQALCE